MRATSVAAVGFGSTPYYRRGRSPHAERKLLLMAIDEAAAMAGIDPADIDGFVSYGADLQDGPRLTGPLGTKELRWSSLVWGGGGGGSAGAIAQAEAAILSGQADTVVVYRATAESTSGRLSSAVSQGVFGVQYRAHGIDAPAQALGLRTQRLLEAEGVPASALKAVAQASYFHANRTPHAVGRDRVLTDEVYDSARLIAEPIRLFDSSRENDAAAAIIFTSAERARDLTDKPVHLLGAAYGALGPRWGELDENHEPYTASSQAGPVRRLWERTGLTPSDVDVVQLYVNFTGPPVAALIDLGFCTPETAGEVLTFDNLVAPAGTLPINTSGGDLAEGFLHGMGNAVEAVRQLRGESWNPVPDARVCLVAGGPISELSSVALFSTDPPA
ncbi:thiolase C-terminal domain-containing protein [Pseudonocardia endophytica]|uniref:Acetyl-CoA acetyltransferase n=1 Tax=Pseudonocardia endophytica TaxID=401976 RepID=A0A4R1HNP4_PSEEN|nr:transporter [Pseudonocardia endophytica]TCK22000.1 acetyl-CoA acetyltransferase [Pseudonocardia endophytica]